MSEAPSQAAIEHLIETIVALGDLKLPSGSELRPLGSALETVNERRQVLTRVQARILVQSKTWAAEVSGRDAEYRIKVADLYENDERVKAAPSKDARMARARAFSVNEVRRITEAKKAHAAWTALLQVCENVQSNLKIAKESISRFLDIAAMELQATAMNPGFGGIPRRR